jgi:hypothetical protein
MNAGFFLNIAASLAAAGVFMDVAKSLEHMVTQIHQSGFFIIDWHHREYHEKNEHLISLALYMLETFQGLVDRKKCNSLLLILLKAHQEWKNFSTSSNFRLLEAQGSITDEERKRKRENLLARYHDIFQEAYDVLDHEGADRRDWDLMIRMLSDFFGRRILTNPFDRQGEDSHNPCKVFWLVDMIMLLTTSGWDVLKMAEASSWEELHELMREYVEEYEDGFFEEFSKIIANSGDAVVERDFSDFEDDSEGDFEDDSESDYSDDDDDFNARHDEFSERFHEWSQPGSSSLLTSCASTRFFQSLKLHRMSLKPKFQNFLPELSCLLIYQLCDYLSRNRTEVFRLLLECMILSHDIKEPQKRILALKEDDDEHFYIITKTMLKFCHMSGSNLKHRSQFQSQLRWKFLWLPRMFEFLSTHSAFASLSQVTSEDELLQRLSTFQAEHGPESRIWRILTNFLADFRY